MGCSKDDPRRSAEGGPLPDGELLDLAAQLADALSRARASSPGPQARQHLPDGCRLLKVLDFGVAKLRDPTGLTTSMQAQAALLENDSADSSGLVLGTLFYMFLEQARGWEVDVWSDVFALGAVLYEMATGRPFFSGGSPNEVIDAVLNHAFFPFSRLRFDFLRGLDRVIFRVFEKHWDDRYQSVTEMLECLRPFQADVCAPANLPEFREPGSGLSASLTGSRQPAPVRGRESMGHVGSLAVLPLHALSSDPEQELLADGMTDALIAHLSRIRALRVISRTSVLRWAERRRSADRRRAGVDAVVEGSCSPQGGCAWRRSSTPPSHSSGSGVRGELRDVLVLQGELV
jgi:serine/threonine protein kinase